MSPISTRVRSTSNPARRGARNTGGGNGRPAGVAQGAGPALPPGAGSEARLHRLAARCVASHTTATERHGTHSFTHVRIVTNGEQGVGTSGAPHAQNTGAARRVGANHTRGRACQRLIQTVNGVSSGYHAREVGKRPQHGPKSKHATRSRHFLLRITHTCRFDISQTLAASSSQKSKNENQAPKRSVTLSFAWSSAIECAPHSVHRHQLSTPVSSITGEAHSFGSRAGTASRNVASSTPNGARCRFGSFTTSGNRRATCGPRHGV